jgi:hypothetical protein
MLESLLFIFLIIVGGIFLIISLVVLTVGLIKKSSKLKKLSLGIGIVPILCFGLITFWYLIAVPSFNKSQIQDFAGAYEINNSAYELITKNGLDKKKPKLILFTDGTYKFDEMEGVGLKKSGTWKTGGIDGLFEFYDERGILSEWASPSGSGKESALSFDFKIDKKDWTNTERILFVKTESE